MNERRRSRNAIAAYDEAKTELEGKGEALEKLKEELDALVVELDQLDKENRALARREGRRVSGSLEFIHEIGRNEKGKVLYRFRLRASNTGKRPGTDQPAMMFHASIWRYKNTVEIWAQDPQVASMTLGSVFSPQSGIEVAGMEEAESPGEENGEATAAVKTAASVPAIPSA